MTTSSQVPTSPTSPTSSQQYRLRRALIPLLCFLIAFNVNFRGIYRELFSAGTHANPVADATREWKNLIAKEKEPSATADKVEEHKEKPIINAEALSPVPDQVKSNVEDPRLDRWMNNLYDEDNYDDDDNNNDDFIWARGECYRNTTITNLYRPPNITAVGVPNNRTTIRRRGAGVNGYTTTTIPRRLIFTYHTNLFDCIFPEHLYINVQKTIQTYADLWGIENKSNVDVMFFDDEDCAKVIAASEPKLVPIFWAEGNGAYRADICRVAALYVYGGYYFDVDIEPIKALDPPPKVDFISAQAGNRVFFQAVMASPARHPLMKHTLETMLVDWYMIPKIMKDHGKTEYEPHWFRSQDYADLRLEHVLQYGFDPEHSIGILMGPATLRIAFDRQANLTTPWLLDEFENRNEKVYPELIRETPHWGCNFMVHDNATKTPYFYSRCRGTGLCPSFNDEKPFYEEKTESWNE